MFTLCQTISGDKLPMLLLNLFFTVKNFKKLQSYLALFTEYILASDFRKGTGVNNKINVS